jgi:membrane protein DedA with SNARE-associated domain
MRLVSVQSIHTIDQLNILLPLFPLAALISLQALEQFLATFGYLAVFLFVSIESLGIPFPGETMLLLGSFFVAIDHRLSLPFVIASAALGAIIGDNIGYTIGRRGGRPLVERYGRYVFVKPEHLARAERFFAKHGSKTVFFGRFISILRTWAAFLAGVNRMHWRTFLIYNAVGGIIWATIYGTFGYLAGRFFHDNFGEVEYIARTVGWVGAGLILTAIAIAVIVIRIRRARKQQQKQQSQSPEEVPL